MILKNARQLLCIKTSVTKRIWHRRRKRSVLARQLCDFYSDLGPGTPVSIDIRESGGADVVFTGLSGRKYPLTLDADVTNKLTKVSAEDGVPIGQVMLHALIEYFSGVKSRAR
jgi:hypothetical protein